MAVRLNSWLRNVRFRPALSAFGPESLANVADNLNQQVHFGRRVVEIETGPCAGGNSQPVVERPGVVMAGADGNSLQIQKLGHVVCVRLRQREAHEAGSLIRRRTEN